MKSGIAAYGLLPAFAFLALVVSAVPGNVELTLESSPAGLEYGDYVTLSGVLTENYAPKSGATVTFSCFGNDGVEVPLDAEITGEGGVYITGFSAEGPATEYECCAYSLGAEACVEFEVEPIGNAEVE